ncbi:NAC domain containing protein [Trema orientale]|uniref:NAC domain containing protein n=1 Tax=Trema orientale TaxID=63057 RepID=A0A2P5DAP1_TREOI|nr:NAC domain containing protein [Trema orientale]
MESEMYKFQLDRNRREGNYFSRKAGEGYWKFHGSEPIIMDETTATIRHVKHTEGLGPFSSTIRYVRLMTKGHCNGRPHRKDIVKGLVRGKHIIGYKTRFVYYKGEAKHGTKTNWVMDEYRVNENYLPNSNKMENLVLCKIYRNRKRKGSTSF